MLQTELLNSISERLLAGNTVRLNMVVILVDFADKPADRAANTPDYYRTLFFSRGVLPTGSLAEYYLENSGGRFILNGEIAGWYRMPNAVTTYTNSQFGLGVYPRNSQGLAQDAVRAADPDINFASFDNEGPDETSDTIDDDQRVDLLMIIHAGQGGETNAGTNTFRSIAWWLPTNEFVDGVNAYSFALGPEEGGIGIFAHEMGHLIGLVDLYDGNGTTSGLGVWSLMSAGWSLNETRTPSHMDAWSKALLGFAPVVNVSGSMADVVLEPVETGGAIYRLPGLGAEYFLVENRTRTGFDAELPGSGLLIYHVDPRQQNNNRPGFYRVAIEQADGRFELERLLGRSSIGDAGDPYDEATPSGGFGRFTTPSSRTNSGEDTGVTVYNVRGPHPDGTLTADFRTMAGPTVQFDGAVVAPDGGNEDRFIDPGETFGVVPRLRVDGGTAHDVRVTLFADDPMGEILAGSVMLGDLDPGLHDVDGLLVQASPDIDTDPYGLELRLEVDYLDEVRFSRSFSAAVGSTEGLVADFEADDGRFAHEITRIGKFDLWRLQDDPGNGSARAWRCSDPDNGFRDRVDASLMTPYFIVPPDGRLIFDHLVEIPRDASNNISAGGLIEISLNGGPWTQVTPQEGYDVQYLSTDSQLTGRRIYTGAPAENVWKTGTIDLSNMSGGARVRFRFFSERVIFTGTGWTIDNVRVQAGGTPVRLLEFSADREPEGVRIHWRLASDEVLTGLRLLRAAGTLNTAFETLAARLPGTADGDFLDVTIETSSAAYRLEALRRDGTALLLGTIRIAAAGAAPPPRLAIYPNPIRSNAVIAFRLDRPGSVRLELFDAGGRKLRETASRVFDAGDHEIAWDGRDDSGRTVSGGVYFYRFTGPGLRITRKVVVLR